MPSSEGLTVPQKPSFSKKLVPTPEESLVDSQGESARLAKIEQEMRRDQAHFWNTLVTAVEHLDFEPADPERIQVLDSACGRCHESTVLNSFLSGQEFGELSPKVSVYGIDQNEGGIECAQGHAPSTPELAKSFTFVVGDARTLNRYPEIPKKVDFALIRHQQFVLAEKNPDAKFDWEEIIHAALDRITENGQLLVTSVSERELKLLEAFLSRIRCEFTTVRNPIEGTKILRDDGSLDQWLTFIK